MPNLLALLVDARIVHQLWRTAISGHCSQGLIQQHILWVSDVGYGIRVPSCPTKGFKYVNRSYIKLMVPNSVATAIMGVNDLGDLGGFYTKADGSRHGFIWFHANAVKTIDHPGTNFVTVPFGINKAGTVGGGI